MSKIISQNIPNLFDLGGMTLFRPTLRQMNVPNGSLGHLISELILFAPVGSLILKRFMSKLPWGDLVLRLWNQAPQGTRHILPRGYDNQRGTADHFGSCFAGETSSSRNQNVLSFTRMTHDRLNSRAVHIFRVWDPYGFNGSIGTFPCPMRFIRLKDLKPLARHGIPVAFFLWWWNAYFGWLMFF